MTARRIAPADIELHIEELVLHGFARADGQAIQDAAQRELAALFEASPPELGRPGRSMIQSLDAGSIVLAQAATPQSLGAKLGQSIFTAVASLHAPPRRGGGE